MYRKKAIPNDGQKDRNANKRWRDQRAILLEREMEEGNETEK